MSELPRQASRYSVTVGAVCDFPGAESSEQAYDWADEIRDKIANVLANYGVSDRRPLVIVWDGGDA